jgi:hypothetical protein
MRMVEQRRRWRYGHGGLVCSDHLGTMVGEEGHKRRTMMGGRGWLSLPDTLVDHLPPGVPLCAFAPQRPGYGMATKAARTVSVTCGHAACSRRPRTPGASAAAGLWPRQHELGANGVWRLHLVSPWQRVGILASPAASSALWSSDLDRDVGHSTSAWSRRRDRDDQRWSAARTYRGAGDYAC